MVNVILRKNAGDNVTARITNNKPLEIILLFSKTMAHAKADI